MSSFFRRPFGQQQNSKSTKNSPSKSDNNVQFNLSSSQPNSNESHLESKRNDTNSICQSVKMMDLCQNDDFLLPCNTEQNIIIGDIFKFVQNPPFVTREEWISTHVFEFFHLINCFYELISENCTAKECGHLITEEINISFESFLRNNNSQITIVQAASMFIDSALTWIDQLLEDPQNFPVRLDGSIREDFEDQVARPIFILLYIVIVHMYLKHFDQVQSLGQVAHLNGLFAHFSAFVLQNSILSSLDSNAQQPFKRLSDELLKRNQIVQSKQVDDI